MVDVAVTHPAAPSKTNAVPLAAAKIVEHAKSEKYNDLARRHATRTEEILKILRAKAKDSAMILPSLGSYADYAAKLLSLALQKGNALIARRGATDALAAVVAQGRRPVGD